MLFLLQPLEYLHNPHLISKELRDVVTGVQKNTAVSRELASIFTAHQDQVRVKVINATLMPNHFHTTLQARDDKAISLYMQRLLNSHTKYINTKYERMGHLFQGPFGATHINKNDQLLYTSCYVHRNQRELPSWKGREEDYQWSTYIDYCRPSRWGRLLQNEAIMSQFANGDEYRAFVEGSVAKLTDEEWDNL